MRIKHIFLTIVLFITSSLIANSVSNLQGSLSVNSGTLNYNVPLTLPVGVAGVQPKLSLNYSSNGANAYFGTGWNITGLSAISRCGSNFTFDSKKSGVAYDSSDNICLDGQRLIPIDNSTNWASGSIYKTKIDSYSKIEYHGETFVVWTKAGDRKEYSLISESWSYLLTKVSDRYGNSINYKYHNADGEIYLEQISYADNKVVFNYETKKDQFNGYSGGKNIKITQRVESIDVKSAEITLRTYKLTYAPQTTAVDKSQLVNITECSSGECLKPLVFEYEKGENALEVGKTWFTNSDSNYAYWDIFAQDINGDGFSDMIRTYKGKWGHAFNVSLNNGSGGFDQGKTWYSNSNEDYAYWKDLYAQDMNGDGLPDLIKSYQGRWGHTFTVLLNNGNGGFDKEVNWYADSNEGLAYWNMYAQDMNGDGLPDLVQTYKGNAGHRFRVSLNNGSGFDAYKSWYSVHPEYYKYIDIAAQDMNGDGLPDLIQSYTGGHGQYFIVSINNGNNGFNASKHWYHTKNSKMTAWKIYAKDMNGDGLADLVHVYQPQPIHDDVADINYDDPGLNTTANTKHQELRVSLNDGTGMGFGPSKIWYSQTKDSLQDWKTYVQDINGDGLPDLVQTYKENTHGYADRFNSYNKMKGHRFSVAINNGNGFNASKSLYSNNAYKDWKIYTQDMNGDGVADLVQTYRGSSGHRFRVSLNNNKRKSLKSIIDSFENKTIINYTELNKKITQPAGGAPARLKGHILYKKYSDSNYPNIDLENSMQVVSSVTAPTSNSQRVTTSYKYEGLKANMRGLGSLGFRKIITSTSLNNSTTETTFNQNYPFIGTVKSSSSYLDGELISKTDNTYSKILKNKIYQIHMTKESTETYEDGTLLNTTTIDNSNFDSYGNIGKIVSKTIDNTTNDEFSKTSVNEYENDADNWILARLEKATVTSKAYGKTQSRTSSFTYSDLTGILKTETIEPDSSKWLKKIYTYDSQGNKINETVSAAGVASRSTKIDYDTLGKYVKTAENALGDIESRRYTLDGQLKSITSANELTTKIEYDHFGKKIKEKRADGTETTYSYAFNSSLPQSYYSITVKSTGVPAVTTYYNSLNQILRTKKIGFDGKEIYKDTFYDKFANVVKKSSPYSQNETPTYTYLEYDKYQRVLNVDSPAPNNQRAISTNSYTAYSVTNTNAKGQIKTTTKNAMGKIVRVDEEEGAYELYNYDALGNLIQTTDSQGNSVKLTYDKFGNKTSQDDPDMGVWNYTYNALGELISQKDAKGVLTTIEYDKLGRKTKETINGTVSTWEYKKGKLYKESKPNFSRVYSYDTNFRPNVVTTTLDSKTFQEKFSYDSLGRVSTKTLPNNFVVKNVYNKFGYLEAIKSPKKQIKDFDPEHFVSLIEKTLESAAEYHRQSLEQIDKAKELQAKAAYYKRVAAQYTNYKEQLLAYATKLEKIAIRYQYYGNLYKRYSAYYKARADRYLNLSEVYSWEWAKRYFKRLSDKYNWYSARYAYYSNYYLKRAEAYRNAADWIENYTEVIENRGNYYLSLAEKTITQSKQAIAIAKQYEEKSEVGYSANVAYQDIAEDSEYSYYYKVLEQDSYNRVTSYISGNGLITTKEYDEAGTLGSITTGYNFDDGIRELHFEYDLLANVTSREDKKLNVSQFFEYDNLNRVAAATTSTNSAMSSMSYAYDSIGNMSYKSDIGSYSYNSNMHGPHQVSSIGTKRFTYDLNGNMLNNDGTTLEYTPFNKVAKIKTAKDTISFNYDTSKRRYKKSTSKYDTYYLGKSYEKRVNHDNTTQEKYFIYAGSKVVSIYENSTAPSTKYLHYDSLNSVDTITNNLGVVESRVAYKPFGERLKLDKYGKVTQTPPKTNRGYTGHEHIEETKFINMNARLYDPTIARFMSADSIIPYMYDTQSFNRYSYVRNNPLKYVDPSGHWGLGFNLLAGLFKDVRDFVKKHWKTIATIAVVAAVVAFAPMLFPALAQGGLGAAIVVGAMAGFTGGVVGTALNGGSFEDAFWNGIRGGIMGGISAGAAYGVAQGTAGLFGLNPSTAHGASFFESAGSGSNWGAATFKALAHGTSRAALANAQRQSGSAAFWSGFAASGFSVGSKDYGGIVGRTAIMATVSGTVSEATGGKFANGAVSGAFVHLFNVENWSNYRDPNKVAFGDRKEDEIFSTIAKNKVVANSMATVGVANATFNKFNVPVAPRMCMDVVIFGGALIYHAGGSHGSWPHYTIPEYTTDVINAIPTKD